VDESFAASCLGGPFRGADAVAAGWVTRSELIGARFVRLLPDVYVESGVPLEHGLLCRAAAVFLRGRGAVSGLSAALLHGVRLVADPRPVEVTVPRGMHLRAQLRLAVVRAALVRGDVVHVRGVPVTSAARTAFDLARRDSLGEAVARVDALLHARVVPAAAISAYATSRARWVGAARVARVLALADAGAGSPAETRTRLILVRGGLPRPVTRHEVRCPGGVTCRLALAYPAHRLGVELAGARPSPVDPRRRDALRAAGWQVLRLTRADVDRRPGYVVALVRQWLQLRSGHTA